MSGRRTRRRRERPAPTPPGHLLRFRHEDWPGEPEAAVVTWWQERENWAAGNGYHDGGSVLGDPLDRLIARRESRMSLLPLPRPRLRAVP